MKTLALAAACALIAAPALAQPAKSSSQPAPRAGQTQQAPMKNQQSPMGQAQRAPGGPATSGIAASPMTADFVNKVAVSDMFEIQSSKLAQQKGDADSKKFASKMVKDHSKTTSELKSMLQKGKVQAQLPAGLDAQHQQKLDQLKSASSAEFNRMYDEAQKQGHQDAVNLFQSYAQNGDNAELKRWAQKTLPHLQEHLKLTNNLK